MRESHELRRHERRRIDLDGADFRRMIEAVGRVIRAHPWCAVHEVPHTSSGAAGHNARPPADDVSSIRKTREPEIAGYAENVVHPDGIAARQIFRGYECARSLVAARIEANSVQTAISKRVDRYVLEDGDKFCESEIDREWLA